MILTQSLLPFNGPVFIVCPITETLKVFSWIWNCSLKNVFSEAFVCFWPSKSDAGSRLSRQMWWGFVPLFLWLCWNAQITCPSSSTAQCAVMLALTFFLPAVLNSHDAYSNQIYLQTIWYIEKCLSTQINIVQVSGFYWRWKCMPCNVIGIHKRSWLLFPGNLCEDVWWLIWFANDVLQRFANVIQGWNKQRSLVFVIFFQIHLGWCLTLAQKWSCPKEEQLRGWKRR